MGKQLKDIPDLPVLQFLQMLEKGEIVSCYNTGSGLTCWKPPTATIHEGFAHSILQAVPYGGEYPTKLRVAKIHSMFKRGLITGCICGCRGDFELTAAGRQALLPVHDGGENG